VTVALLATLSLVLPHASAQSQTQIPAGNRSYRLAGLIASASAGTFVLTVRGGRSVTIHTARSTRIISRQTATLADIHAGSTVHIVATKAADGTLAAQVVQDITFGPFGPAAMRQGSQNESGPAVIVGSVAGRPTTSSLMVITLTGERASVAVPPTARITRWVPMTASSLTAGTPVLVQAVSNADGNLTASVVIVRDKSGN
jgi:hypothetical protein